MSPRRSLGLRVLFVLGLMALAAGLGAWAVVYWTLLRDLPDLRTTSDYKPPVVTRVLDRRGEQIGEFYEERRQLTPFEAIPRHVILAFVAGEDSSFFEHRGIDWRSILRAAWVNLMAGGEIKQGGSTITQQTVKTLLLTPERKLQRKIKELILARRLEQSLSKDEILYLYLNQIYFGGGAWGIGEAARTYFGKRVDELDVSEAALLAGLPQRPSAYSPTSNPQAAESRRRYVLRRMFEEGFVDEATYTAALEHPPAIAPSPHSWQGTASATFVEEVRRVLFDRFGGDTVLRSGLVVETTLDTSLQEATMAALRSGLEALDRRQGWRGALRRVEPAQVEATLAELAHENALDGEDGKGVLPRGRPLLGVITRVDKRGQRARVAFAPGLDASVHLEDVSWAREPDPRRQSSPVRSIDAVFRPGDVARFRVRERTETERAGEARADLLQEPLVEGAVLTLDVASGDVLALAGGYDFTRSQFDRALQSRRQPGSAFKPIIYGAALHNGRTPASLVVDRPVVYTDPESGFTWRPENYSRRFLGPLTLREALARSVNNATIHLTREVGVGQVIDYARRLGIRSPLERNLSIALGSSGVSLLELTRAYATFPAGGQRVVPRFIVRVTDRDGQVLLENVTLDESVAEAGDPTRARSGNEEILDLFGLALEETEAFLVTSLLRAVVEDPQGTGRRARSLGRPVAGKTGTTNEQGDAWFVGFSPDVVTGVWVGHDEKRVLGRGETGSRAALPIWMDVMKAALAKRPARDFSVPRGIVFAKIDRKTGLLSDASDAEGYFQAFLEGTEPTETADKAVAATEGGRLLRLDSF